MRFIFNTLLLLTMIVSGCAVQKTYTKPEPAAEYPDSLYLKAEGIGQSEAEARNQAVAEMSRIFRSKVVSDTYDRVSEIIDETGGETFRSSMESNIRVVSSVEFEGARIARAWFDSDERVYRAVAVLNRQKAGEDWKAGIRDIDSKISAEFSAYDAAESRYLKLRHLMNVLDHWVEREVLVSRLRILGHRDTAGKDYDIKRAFSLIPGLKAGLRIFLSVSGIHGNEIEGRISGALNSAGFMIVGERARADVIVSGDVQSEPVELDNPGWEFARATVSLRIFDASNGAGVGEISDDARAGHLTYNEAVYKAVRKVSTAAAAKVMEYFE